MGLGEGGRKRASTLWHLVGSPSHKNLGEVLQKILAQHLDVLQQAARAALPADTPDESSALASQAEEQQEPDSGLFRASAQSAASVSTTDS
jgi:hypothetical protein